MKHVLILCICLLSAVQLYSQNSPVPDYLTTQDFPDSVRMLGVENLVGKKTTFAEILKSYEGKRVLIDIWASWCGDCIVGYPKLDALRNKVMQDNFVLIFLSVDKDKQKWKNAIAKHNIRGDHYLLDNDWKNALTNYLVLDWVPRYVVLNEKGKVVLPKAISAEDTLLQKAVTENSR